jgi:putative flippase GtrA
MRTVRRWGLFNLVGAGGFVLQMAVLATLTRLAGWHYGPASVVAIELAIIHNFVAHGRWTWGDRAPRSRHERLRTFGRYQLAKTASLIANVALTAWLVRSAGLPVEAASGAAVLALSVVNFLVADALVFSREHTPPRAIAVSPGAASPPAGSDFAVLTREVESCDSSWRRWRSSWRRADARRSSS